MALTFDTHEAIRKLRGKGHSESQAEGIVEFVSDATGQLVTNDHFQAGMDRLEASMDAREGRLRGEFRAELYRVSLIQGGIIIGAVVALVKLL